MHLQVLPLSLAKPIMKAYEFEHYSLVEGEGEQASPSLDTQLVISYERKDDVKGVHTVGYTSAVDKLVLHHEAYSRVGFAAGAVIAAGWLQGKKGVYTAIDVYR